MATSAPPAGCSLRTVHFKYDWAQEGKLRNDLGGNAGQKLTFGSGPLSVFRFTPKVYSSLAFGDTELYFPVDHR